MRRGQVWNHITYDGRIRIPLMRKGLNGRLYDSGEVEDWQHDLICECGYTWSVKEADLRGKTLRKAFPVCCGRPECLYNPPPKCVKSNLPKTPTEPRILVSLTLPYSLHQKIEKMIAAGRFKNRSESIVSGVRYWIENDTTPISSVQAAQDEYVLIEDVEHEWGI